ncbi:choice-of-anchor B family protein [Flavobacteriaceae bacterium YJPT1-3]|nr:choice-of-anchor B family protein [Flavobacteriaceae bacterium YJPT1-3]
MEVTDPEAEGEDLNDKRVPCENGLAGVFPCQGYDLMAQLDCEGMGATRANDSWGWTDPSTGREYALVGLNNGTAFVDISTPDEPIYLGKLPTATESSTWRDIKVYQDHAFIVSEAPEHGMQVFDLTQLRSVTTPPETFTASARYIGFGNAHNIVINEDTAYAYAVGTSEDNGAPQFIDISDPLNPQFAGSLGISDYSHDAQVVTYNGPDTDYQGQEILIGSNTDEVVIFNVTDKQNPTLIASTRYPNIGYTHQGWFTEDQRYFLVNDELDEVNFGFNSRALVFDFSDLDNPVLFHTYEGPTAAIDHNFYIRGNQMYLANYRAGMRVVDISGIGARSMNETGFFDTFPSSNSPNFNGAWNVYPYFDSGNIIISDIDGGLFIVRPSGT